MPEPLLQGAAAGAQGRGLGEQFRFVELARPDSSPGRVLSSRRRPIRGIAEIGGDGHRKGAPASGAPSPAVRDGAPPPAGGVHGAGRSPGSRILGPHLAPLTTDPTFPAVEGAVAAPPRRSERAGGSPPTVAGAAADLPGRGRPHGVPFSPARAGPTLHKNMFISHDLQVISSVTPWEQDRCHPALGAYSVLSRQQPRHGGRPDLPPASASGGHPLRDLAAQPAAIETLALARQQPWPVSDT